MLPGTVPLATIPGTWYLVHVPYISASTIQYMALLVPGPGEVPYQYQVQYVQYLVPIPGTGISRLESWNKYLVWYWYRYPGTWYK